MRALLLLVRNRSTASARRANRFVDELVKVEERAVETTDRHCELEESSKLEVGVMRVSEAVLKSLERDSGSGEAVVIEWLYIPNPQARHVTVELSAN